MREFPVQSGCLALADKQSLCLMEDGPPYPSGPPQSSAIVYFLYAAAWVTDLSTASISLVTVSMSAMPSTLFSLPLA